MAVLKLSKSGSKLRVQVGDEKPTFLPLQDITYGFAASSSTLVVKEKPYGPAGHEYRAELSDLRLAGSGSAPASEDAALTTLEAIFP